MHFTETTLLTIHRPTDNSIDVIELGTGRKFNFPLTPGGNLERSHYDAACAAAQRLGWFEKAYPGYWRALVRGRASAGFTWILALSQSVITQPYLKECK